MTQANELWGPHRRGGSSAPRDWGREDTALRVYLDVNHWITLLKVRKGLERDLTLRSLYGQIGSLPISLTDEAGGASPGASLAGASTAAEGDPIRNPTSSLNHVCRVRQGEYAPDEMSVRPGHTVTWVNEDGYSHTITSGTPEDGPDGTFDGGMVDGGSSFSHRFQRRGRYWYFCMAHPWQNGTVTFL